ncbi:acetyl-CoA carboxylase [Halalkalicoccus jeotgali]|uniref:Biotin/lipoyl attachment domain-containing protein n=1 Tax=Halalkalicoccus jeotgali (strain DSM 18796 / CECT 7217 / JCM 14584 / KCTC 4019 / B3) TaxID=795797 RepID=D8J625_HALJB|nr:acetyl-CoA carboxylase [Halalkalicoccus jeotgali]ADJ13831.1 biotin/lipoyl attachment domain-containing protein [Halalkalicoccus jeotgali B3]ELY34123.1 biotin/lipoyl attachment domain-containing protein [Halalkalicoccus jeotgali B3]
MTDTTTIQAPMPGVFYRRSDPEKPPLAEPGDRVEAGETIALIGVMKNFNDVTTDVSGTVSEFLVENEAEIKAGDDLVVIDLE